MDIAIKDKDGITVNVIVNADNFEQGDNFAKEKCIDYHYCEIIEDLNFPETFKLCIMDTTTVNNLLKMYPKL